MFTGLWARASWLTVGFFSQRPGLHGRWGRYPSRVGVSNRLPMSAYFNPEFRMAGEYLPLDGTIEFYGRVNAIVKPTDVVVDLGAGRGAWYFEDTCETRRRVRDVRARVGKVIGVDVDPVVLSNPT